MLASNLGVTLWPPTSSYFRNKDILITGVLIINTPVAFVQSDVKFEDGGRIVVWYNGRIWSRLSDFFGCGEMWPGIDFVPAISPPYYTRGEFYYSRIEDAQYALSPASTTRLTLLDNKFNRNYVAIRNRETSGPDPYINLDLFAQNVFDCNSELSTPFSGQTPDPGDFSFCGVLLNSAVATFGAQSANNTFINMQYGVLAANSSFAIPRSKFGQMQTASTPSHTGGGIGIDATTCDVGIRNCIFEENTESGVRTHASILDINNSEFIDNHTGIIAGGNNAAEEIRVINNFFESHSNSSIQLVRSVATEGTHNVISSNQIIGSDGALQIGELTISSINAATDFMLINDNHISFDDNTDPRGILVWFSRSDNFILDSDTVVIMNDKYASGGGGIRFSSELMTEGSEIQNCLVTGDGANNEASIGISGFGMSVSAPMVTVCDNTVSGFVNGLYFFGNCDMSTIGLNAIGPCDIGLRVSGVNGVIGVQDRTGNTWDVATNAFEEFGARNFAPSDLIPESWFFVHSSDPEFNPTPVNPTNWFILQEDDPEGCGFIAEPHFTGYDSIIIAGYDSLSSALLWNERRRLMYKLFRYPDLRDDAGSFYTAGLDSTYGKFAIVDTMIPTSFLSNRDEFEDIDQQTSLLNLVHAKIAIVDSLQEDIALYGDSLGLTNDSLAVVKFKLLDSLQYYFNDLLEMKEDLYDLQLASLLDVKDYNDNIATYEQWQENQKIVNHYTIMRGMRQETSEDGLDSLRAIASTCLDEGGMAVYPAIHLLPVCEWVDYPAPEKVSCGRNPTFITSAVTDADIAIFDVELSPIPVSGILNIEMTQPTSGKFELFSMKGESILAQRFYDVKQFTISTREVPSGFYSWRLTTDFGTVRSDKLIVVH